MLVDARNIVTTEKDEVIVGEDSIVDKGVGGVIKGYGKVAKVGGGSIGNGVIGDGEGDWCWGGGGLVL